MRLKEFFYLLGFKPNTQFYAHRVERIDVEGEPVDFAQWLAPKTPKMQVEAGELAELRRFLSAGDFAVDVGAHIGDSTLPIALACGATGAVLALEPNPLTFAVLAANASLNPGRTNIVPLPFAATDEDCVLQFDYGDPWLSNGGGHAGVSKWRHGSAFSIPVNGTNVARLLRGKFADRLPRLRYIKIDVEGSDYSVVQSLAEIITAHRPHIKLEVGRPTTLQDRQGIEAFFGRNGYELRLVVDRRSLFGPKLTHEHLYGKATIDVFAIPN